MTTVPTVAAPHQSDSSRVRLAWKDAAALLLIALAFTLLAGRLWFLSDDAFISFRYARNWAAGNGLRYNLGEQPPVEGYSNFLWVAVCAGIELLGLDPVRVAPLVSLGCGLALLAALYLALLRRLGFPREVAFLATLVLGLFPPFATWATGGMETMPFALTLFLTFDALVLAERTSVLGCALPALAMSLLRTEGILWAGCLGAVALVARPIHRDRVRSLAAAAAVLSAGFGAYFVGRYFYYHLLFPTPVYLKVGFGTDVLLRGYRYVVMFVLNFLTPLAILPCAVVALWKGPLRTALATVAMAVAVPAYAIVVGGDWMIMGRFLVPGLSFQALLGGWLLAALWDAGARFRRYAAAGLAVAAIAVGLLPAWNLQIVPESVRVRYRYMYSHPGFRSEYEEWVAQKEGVAYSKELGLAFKSCARPGDSLVTGAIGAIGYYSDLYIYDRFGLVSREVVEWARQGGAGGRLRSPGHDIKVSRDRFLDEHPTFLLFDAIESPTMRSRVLEQAKAWRELGSLWRTYAPDFVPLDGKPVSETGRVLIFFRAIEDDPGVDVDGLPRTARRRLRADRADEVWGAFYERAALLPEGPRPKDASARR